MLILSRADVEALLDPAALIDAMATALAELSAGGASAPDRVAARVKEHGGLLAAMPGHVPALGALAAKLVTLFPGNAGGPLPTHQALVAVFDPATGEPVAIMDGTAITALRTGACSALATRLLAREDARVLAIVGTGVQARAHARTVRWSAPSTRCASPGRDPAAAGRLAEELRAAGLPARAAPRSRTPPAARTSCAPARTRPSRCWSAHGSLPAPTSPPWATTRTGGDSTPPRSPTRSSSWSPAPRRSRPRRPGRTTSPGRSATASSPPAHVHAELGELVAGTRPGRGSPEQLTVYKSVGIAVEDAAAAALVLAGARARGSGRTCGLMMPRPRGAADVVERPPPPPGSPIM